MTAPFDTSAHRAAHVLLDRLVELEVPLSRDLKYALFDLGCVDLDPSGRVPATYFPELAREPRCQTCGAFLAASRTVQVTDTETVERRLYECGAVETVNGLLGGGLEALAPCGDTERRVAAEMARAALEETEQPEVAPYGTWTGDPHHPRCPLCGVQAKLSTADNTTSPRRMRLRCQDGEHVSRRFPGHGPPCPWRGVYGAQFDDGRLVWEAP
jgi:hypothetical protein